MSKDWVQDIADMHSHYKVHEAIANFDTEKLAKLLEFRINFLKEEYTETRDNAQPEDFCAEEIVDGLIDLCVVAIGTLDIFKVDAHEAWDRVLKANMAKEPGVKPERPNPLGLPDLIKPDGWKAPSHEGNHGFLIEIERPNFEEKS